MMTLTGRKFIFPSLISQATAPSDFILEGATAIVKAQHGNYHSKYVSYRQLRITPDGNGHIMSIGLTWADPSGEVDNWIYIDDFGWQIEDLEFEFVGEPTTLNGNAFDPIALFQYFDAIGIAQTNKLSKFNKDGSLYFYNDQDKVSYMDVDQPNGVAGLRPDGTIDPAKLPSGSTLPAVTSSDNGKFLRVTNGAWAVEAIANANGVSF